MVIQTANGATAYRSAIDTNKAEHAFGAAGSSLAAVAHALCKSLAEHWQAHGNTPWKAPFEGAGIARVVEFTASTEAAAMEFALDQHSSLAALLRAYELSSQSRPPAIVKRVRSAVRQAPRSHHLARRFERSIDLGADAGPLVVDFLGQHFACYFISLTTSVRGVEPSAERAFGKLFELQAVRRFVHGDRKTLGLLEDERPEHFELLAVGDKAGSAERRALSRIEAIADQREVRLRQLPDVASAAAHVVAMELQAA